MMTQMLLRNLSQQIEYDEFAPKSKHSYDVIE